MLSFPPSPSVRIFVARHPVDMRKGFDGLSGYVIDTVEQDPLSGHLFVFFNRRRNRMKCMVWDGTGLWLLYKRLEHGQYAIFDRRSEHDGAYEIDATELALLLDGIDLRGAKRRQARMQVAATLAS
jgi:transposase